MRLIFFQALVTNNSCACQCSNGVRRTAANRRNYLVSPVLSLSFLVCCSARIRQSRATTIDYVRLASKGSFPTAIAQAIRVTFLNRARNSLMLVWKHFVSRALCMGGFLVDSGAVKGGALVFPCPLPAMRLFPSLPNSCRAQVPS